MIEIHDDAEGEYFFCEKCGMKCSAEAVETDKWWDDEGNHRMIYICPECGHENYEK